MSNETFNMCITAKTPAAIRYFADVHKRYFPEMTRVSDSELLARDPKSASLFILMASKAGLGKEIDVEGLAGGQ